MSTSALPSLIDTYKTTATFSSTLPVTQVSSQNQLDGAYILLQVPTSTPTVTSPTYAGYIMQNSSDGQDYVFVSSNGSKQVGSAAVFLCKSNSTMSGTSEVFGYTVYNLYQVTASTPNITVNSFSINHDGYHLHMSNDLNGDNQLSHVFAFRDNGSIITSIASFDSGWQNNDYLSPDPGQSLHCASNTTLNNLTSAQWQPALPQIVVPSPYMQFYQLLESGSQYLCCANSYSTGSIQQEVCETSFNLPAQCANTMNAYCSNPTTTFVTGSSTGSMSMSPVCTTWCNASDINCNTQLSNACQSLMTTMTAANANVDFFTLVPDCGCFVPSAGTTFCSSLETPFATAGLSAPPCIPSCSFPPCTNSNQRTLYKQSTSCPNVTACLQSLTVNNSGSINGNLTSQDVANCSSTATTNNTTPATTATTTPTTTASTPTTAPTTTTSSTTPATNTSTGTTSGNNNYIWIIVGISIFIVLIAGIIGILKFRRSRQRHYSSTTTTTNTRYGKQYFDNIKSRQSTYYSQWKT